MHYVVMEPLMEVIDFGFQIVPLDFGLFHSQLLLLFQLLEGVQTQIHDKE